MKRIVVCAVALLLALPAPTSAGRGRDPLLGEQWGLVMIDAEGAWMTARGDGAVIAVLDSGIAVDHPDLRGNVGRAYDAVTGRPGPGEPGSHGTWVAGIAAAVGGNGEGISGVAPAATIMPVRVCDDECPARAVAAGIRYAARHGADVINLSLYVGLLDEGIDDVLDAAAFARDRGAVVVAAAGNNSEPWCVEPAASALCVGATDRWDRPASYSNRDVAMRSRYLVAPGGSWYEDCAGMVVSTTPHRTGPTVCAEGSYYARTFGTSGAAPHVS
ncbi:MAG: S8 family serine peptidase, partial [Actinomycetota bacterium]|nr:S8 family serine peptidase [Actinomycetota bacterium]